MKRLMCAVLGVTLALGAGAVAAANRAMNGYYYQSGEFNTIHPEEAYPDNLPRMASPGPYADLVQQVQARLHQLGFDAGPLNGDFGSKTQAALAQFQLSESIPASGQLDAPTLDALGLQAPAPTE